MTDKLKRVDDKRADEDVDPTEQLPVPVHSPRQLRSGQGLGEDRHTTVPRTTRRSESTTDSRPSEIVENDDEELDRPNLGVSNSSVETLLG